MDAMGLLEVMQSHAISTMNYGGKHIEKQCTSCGDKYIRVGQKWVPLSPARPCPGTLPIERIDDE